MKKNRTDRNEMKTKKLFAAVQKRGWFCAAAGSVFVSFCAQWGRQLDSVGNVNMTAPSTWLAPLGAACILTPLLAVLFSWLEHQQRRAAYKKGSACSGGRQESDRCFWRSWTRLANGWCCLTPSVRILLRAAGLFFCWLPVFLAVYPGFFAYDATDELTQVLTGEYVTRHPLVHVLMLGKTIAAVQERTGSYNTGIAVYVSAQMVFAALLLGWVLEEMKRAGAGRLLNTGAALFFGLFPVIPMYVLCTSKDMPYTAGMLALLVLLWRLCRQKEVFWQRKGQVIGLGTALFVTAVFRSNGFGVFLLMIPVLLRLAGKGFRKKMAALAAFVLAAYFGLQTGLNMVLQPESTGAMEGLTVPIQQLARTWHYSPEIFSQEEQETLFEILPEESLERYQPKLSDPVKAGFQSDAFRKNPGRYAALWVKTGLKSPFSYGNAWLMTSYGFWYPDTVIDVYNGWREYTESSYFSCETEAPGERHSYFPWLERQYEKISWEKEIHETPVVSWLFSPGALCWVWVLCGLYLLSAGRKREAAVLLPVYFNLLTVLIGPTFLVRYVLIFWFGLPVLLSISGGLCYTAKDNEKVGNSAH